VFKFFMKGRNFTISLIIALIYWLPSSLALLNIIKGFMVLPFWVDLILMPGYIIGFTLSYGGGILWAIIGQLITLIVLFFIARAIYEPFRRKKNI